MTAFPDNAHDTLRTSFVILTLDELQYTRRCVESLARHVSEPHELIFVDNGSTDGTVEYLRSIPGATVITNTMNMGFGGGCNQGIAVAQGERICLLNNDTVVTAGWLDELHTALDADPEVGIAGPVSNHVAGVQRIADVGYDIDSLDGLADWSAAWSTDHRGQRHEVPRVIGFCMLIERDVFTVIGGFDVRFGLGNFEDDDLCLRAGVAGFGSVVCEGSFVHHFGSRTFAGTGIDWSATMASNWQRFAAKWGLRPQLDGGAYDPTAMLASTMFDPERHYAPVVARQWDGEQVHVESRSTTLLTFCDIDDPDATREVLDAALRAVRPEDDITVLVRLAADDAVSPVVLDEVADAIERELGSLPDVAVVEVSSLSDEAVIRVSDIVVESGRRGWVRAGHARSRGRGVVSVSDLRSGTIDLAWTAAA